MSATQQKIAWARRAIAELNKAQSNASRDDFQYHFGAFLALIGALRQFITVDPHKQWVYSMDAADLNYCSCIDLRNVDVHIDNAVGTPRSEFTANPPVSRWDGTSGTQDIVCNGVREDDALWRQLPSMAEHRAYRMA
ncbi:MAG: hypothetical protein ACLPSH_16430, partial [Vulcanimicrobiaceae bacterium]